MAVPREDVTLLIDREVFGYWSEIEISLSLDSFATVSFTAPFERERKEFREIFRPFSFKRIEVLVNLSTVFVGTMVDVFPYVEKDQRKIDVTGYALPAVLGDCMEPVSALPLEFKKLSLRAILETLAVPFGLKVAYLAPEGTPFDKAKLDVDKKVADFLADLTKQRNVVLSNTRFGDLLCWQSAAPGKPVARLVEGLPPVTKVKPSYSPQDYYSEITGYAKKKKRKAPVRWTEQNPWLTNVLRPYAFKLDDTDRADAPEATKAKLGRMFANMASYTIEDMPTWRDQSDNLWEPNTTLTLNAPDAMVYRETELLVRGVNLKQTKDETSASLNVVLPGAFSGEVPEVLPWQE